MLNCNIKSNLSSELDNSRLMLCRKFAHDVSFYDKPRLSFWKDTLNVRAIM